MINALAVLSLTLAAGEPDAVQAQRRGFSCVVEGVRDGASFYCRDGTPVRLHGINPPAIDRCRRGADCEGQRSRAALHRMIAGRRVDCTRTGMTFSRITAWCSVGGEDLSCTLFHRNLAARRTNVDQDDRLCRED